MNINNNHSSNPNRAAYNTHEESKVQDNQTQKRLFPFSNSDLENPAKEVKLTTVYEQLKSIIQSGNSQALSDFLSKCKRPIDINHMTDNGDTLLHVACEKGYVDIVNILLKNNINPQIRNKNDYTVLHIACENDHIEVARMLVEKYPDLINDETIKYNYGTVLHIACAYGHIEIVRMLIEKHPDMINETNDNTALHIACENGYIEIARTLIKKYPNLGNKKNNNGRTALHIACENEHIKIVRMLIEKYPYLVNEKDNEDKTALHLACERGHRAIIKMLITHRVDINIRTKDNETCLDIISGNDQLDDDEKETLLKDLIDFILVENTIAIKSENYLFLSPDTFDEYSEYISPNLRIILKTLIDKIKQQLLVIDKPIYIIHKDMIHKVVELDDTSKDRVNFTYNINNTYNIEKIINRFIIKQFKPADNAMRINGFTLMLTCLTAQDKQEIINRNINNTGFTMSWVESGETFTLEIGNINLSLFTNRVVNRYNLISNNNPINNNNFKDVTFTFNH